MIKEKNEKTDMIEKFLNKRLINRKGTRDTYKSIIKKYFELIDKDMNTYFNQTPEQIEEDLETLYNQLHKQGKGELGLKTFFSPVKLFMQTNNKELKELDIWDTMKARVRGAEPKFQKAALNAEAIKKILNQGDTLSRAMFLMLASSGRRIGEILALNPEDINTTVSPATISITKSLRGNTIQPTKTKQTTTCYMSDEAKEAYLAWMNERDDHLRKNAKRSKWVIDEKEKLKDTRVFPISYNSALVKWHYLIIKAGIVDSKMVEGKDGRTRREVVKKKGEHIPEHPHCLRGFYRSYLGNSDFAEFLMGHGTSLTKTYRDKPAEDKAAMYLQLMPNVTIFESVPDLSGINESLKEKDVRITQLEQKIREMGDLLLKLSVEKQIEERKNK